MSVKIIKKPRLSVNQLAEFNHATSKKRESIIVQSKYPKDGKGFGKYRSKLVDSEIHQFICDRDEALLEEAKQNVLKRPIIEDWHKTDRENSLAMLDSILNYDFKKLDKYKLQLNTNHKKQSIHLEGLEVSVYPRVLIFDENDSLKGGIVTRLTKGLFSKEKREDVSLLIHEYLKNQKIYDSSQLDRKLCLSFNVRASSMIEAPSSFKRRLENLESAARQAVILWDAL